MSTAAVAAAVFLFISGVAMMAVASRIERLETRIKSLEEKSWHLERELEASLRLHEKVVQRIEKMAEIVGGKK